MASIQRRPDGRWRARYRDESGKEHARHFRTKTGAGGAQEWLDQITSSKVTGTYIDPKTAKTTMAAWCET